MKTRLKILLLRKVESWISTKMIQQVLDHVVDTEIDDDVWYWYFSLGGQYLLLMIHIAEEKLCCCGKII